MPGIDEPAGILELNDGWLIAGRTTSNSIFSSPVAKFGFLMKLDLEGKVIWQRFYGDTVNWDIFGSGNFGSDNISSNCLRRLSNGKIVVMGSSGYKGYSNAFVMECNPDNGDIIWIYRDTFPDFFSATDLCEDNNGNVYLLCLRMYFNQLGYPCVFKLDKNGKHLWNKHFLQYDGNFGSHIVINKDNPVICLNLSSNVRDSVVLLMLDEQNGEPQQSWILNSKNSNPNGISVVIQLFEIKGGYNILIDGSTIINKNLQLFLDTNFKIISKKFITPYDTIINLFHREGYSFYNRDEKLLYFSNAKNEVELRAVPCLSDTNIVYFEQSIHGGAYQLCWVYTEGKDQWGSCNNKFDCKDIVFVKSDSSGRYDTGPRQPSVGEVLIYPNPVSNLLTVNFELEKQSGASFEIYDALGQLVLALPFRQYSKGYQEIEMDITLLTSGIYTFKFFTEEINLIQKVLIQ